MAETKVLVVDERGVGFAEESGEILCGQVRSNIMYPYFINDYNWSLMVRDMKGLSP